MPWIILEGCLKAEIWYFLYFVSKFFQFSSTKILHVKIEIPRSRSSEYTSHVDTLISRKIWVAEKFLPFQMHQMRFHVIFDIPPHRKLLQFGSINFGSETFFLLWRFHVIFQIVGISLPFLFQQFNGKALKVLLLTIFSSIVIYGDYRRQHY